MRYLGLLENVRVRRAGYANRQPYAHFLNRYKLTCPATWPNWKGGDDRSGVQAIVRHHGFSESTKGDNNHDVAYGKTKIFISHAVTLAKLEQAREQVEETGRKKRAKGKDVE